MLQAATAAWQTLRDLQGLSWPSVLDAAAQPLGRHQAPPPDHAGGLRRRPGHWWVAAERVGAAERASFAVADWQRALQELGDVEDGMVAVLDQLGLTRLVTTITGLSAAGAAAILAETGDPTCSDIARTWAKHAGLCPRDNTSGRFQGQTTTSGRGRPGLRTAAWRAIWGPLPHNPVFAARYAHLTGRAHNPLTDGQARAALAAALLRRLHAVCTRRQAWDPKIAAGEVTATAA